MRTDGLLLAARPDRDARARSGALVAEAERLGYRPLGPCVRPDEADGAPTAALHLMVRGDDVDGRFDGERATVVIGVVVGGDARTLARHAEEGAAGLGPIAAAWQGNWVALHAGKDEACVVTDQLGSWTVSTASASGVQVFGTSMMDVARLTGHGTIDTESAREFLARGAVSSPHTLIAGVRRLWPGSSVVVDAAGEVREHVDWAPTRDRGPSSVEESAHLLRSRMERLVEGLIGRYGSPTILFSGGEDSRVLGRMFVSAGKRLGQSQSPDGVILTDAENREFQLARAAARRIGLTLHARTRPSDHYIRHIERLQRVVGPGIDLASAHVVGLLEEGTDRLHVDGWTADTFFKGLYLPRHRTMRLGFRVALDRAAEPVKGLPKGFVGDPSRYQEKLERIAAFRDEREIIPWSRMWPVGDHQDYGMFATGAALLRYISPFMTGDLVAAAAGLDEDAKLDRALFQRAFGRTLGSAGLVPRSGGQIPRLGPYANLVAEPVVNAAFRAADAVGQRRGRVVHPGPWQPRDVLAAAVRSRLGELDPPLVAEACRLTGTDHHDGLKPLVQHRLLQLALLPGTLAADGVRGPS